MKYTFLFILFLSSAIVANAQDAKADSTESPIAKIIKTEKEEQPDPPKTEAKEEKEGFGDTLLSLGKGFLERLKYRFNLEAVENKVEKAQQKFKKKEENKRGS